MNSATKPSLTPEPQDPEDEVSPSPGPVDTFGDQGDGDPERFLCPQCGRPTLAATLSQDVGMARCIQCDLEVEDLLSLVPVKPVGLVEMTLGQGGAAYVRAVAFVLAVVLLLALAIAGR